MPSVLHVSGHPARVPLRIALTLATTLATAMATASAPVAAAGAAAVPAPAAQAPAPPGPAELELDDLSGEKRALSDLRGCVVVLNFWATWCLPCVKEMPALVDLQRDFGARGVRVIAVSADDPAQREAVERFARRHDLSFPVWVGGTTVHMESLGLGIALPATALLDPQGRVADRILGPFEEDDLRRRVELLLGEGTADPTAETGEPGPAGAAHRHEEGEEGRKRRAGEARHEHHEGEEEHEHGGVGIEGASLVPS